MQDAKVNLNWRIGDLYERDERTGETKFKNPDRPGQYFSSRMEAQQYVDSMNKQVAAAYREEVLRQQQQMLKDAAPQMRLLDFATAYQVMDQDVRDILDDLVEPYAIMQNGRVVGYNCDLNAAANQAMKIASRFKAQREQYSQPAAQPQQKQTQPGKMPAMDMKTGTGEAGSEEEPKDLNEALLMYRKQQQKGK